MSIFGFGKKSKGKTGPPILDEKLGKKDTTLWVDKRVSDPLDVRTFSGSCVANFRSQYPKPTRILIGSEEICLKNLRVSGSNVYISSGWDVEERGANGTKIQKHSKGSEIFAAVPTEAEVKAWEKYWKEKKALDLKIQEKAKSYQAYLVRKFGLPWSVAIFGYFKNTEFTLSGVDDLRFELSIEKGMKTLAMEMPRGLVDVILGKPGDTKQSVSKNKTEVTAFYGAEKGARGGVSYQIEVKFENDVVVGWKEK